MTEGDAILTGMSMPLLKVDCVTVPVPDLEAGLRFYRDRLGHTLLWRNDTIGQAGLRTAESDTEIVLTTKNDSGPVWLVSSVDDAAREFQIIDGPIDIPVGRLVVVADPFGNTLVLLDLSKGRYITDDSGVVIGVDPAGGAGIHHGLE